MGPLGWILLTTGVISLLAWIGILTLFLNDAVLEEILLLLVALAAGSLIGGAFLHLLPRAIGLYGAGNTLPLFLYTIAGFCLFYLLEQFIQWHHHHAATHDHEPVTYLVLLADTVHNFIDGLVVAGAFLLSVDVGLVTAAAIGLHEIPQEIGDFGVLVYGGFEEVEALVLNFLTQATVIVGGVVGYLVGGHVEGMPAVLLPFAAGTFIYIASSDLIPEMTVETNQRKATLTFGVFLLGILLMLGVRLFREGMV